jgi:hypothetical protein
MREIKFRGKRIDNGEWVQGYFLVAAGMPFISAFGERSPILVIPETVGQYTGLKDKNGNEIYEGDIAKDPDGNVFEVIWNKGAASFELLNKTSSFLLVQRYVDIFEVIGNVHDNPNYWRNQNE